MRVGVLTFHRCINYGSYWQARCLVEAIAARGHEALLLDHRSCAVTSREWRYAFQPLLPDRSPRADIARYGVKLRRFLRDIEALPLSAPFALEGGAAPPVDLAVVGSDEVFNLSHPWYGREPLFWGEGLRAPRIAYAASFGNYDASAGLAAEWADRLAGFAAVAVRDENSRALVAGATGAEPPMVLDPVLLNPPAPGPRPAAAGTDPYLLVYGHHLPDWFAARIRAAAGRRGWRTLSVGYRNDWADAQWLEAGPGDFAALVAGAEAVATTYFHGCVFALALRRPFVCAPSDYRWTKLRDLTVLLDAWRHMTFEDRDPAEIEPLLDAPATPATEARIRALRAQSEAYLDGVLA